MQYRAVSSVRRHWPKVRRCLRLLMTWSAAMCASDYSNATGPILTLLVQHNLDWQRLQVDLVRLYDKIKFIPSRGFKPWSPSRAHRTGCAVTNIFTCRSVCSPSEPLWEVSCGPMLTIILSYLDTIYLEYRTLVMINRGIKSTRPTKQGPTDSSSAKIAN